jgi:PAS domain S-box-containing protein
MASSRPRANNSQLERLFPGDSEMAGRMRAFDWSATAFGPPENWPENLRVAVSICLPCRLPILLWWGPKACLLYNDAYLSWLTEEKHPRALGRPGIECWPEIWDVIGPMMESVLATGKATWSEDMEMYFNRRLPKEEVYITYTYAPILAPDGQTVDGIFNPATETTEKVVGARRLETLRKLGVRSPETRTVEAACHQAAAVLSENPRDIPFAAIYLVNATGAEAIMSAAMIPEGEYLLPHSVSLSRDDSPSPWPLASVLRTKRTAEIGDLGSLGVRIPGEPWPELVSNAIVLPIYAAPDTLAGLLVAGTGPRRPWDTAYRTFFELVARHVGSAISEARAYEEERRRAETLAEIDRAKTVFFSNVSHEFRTPLTLMLASLEDLLAKGEAERLGENQAILNVAHRNGLRLLKLVNTLLDFSRIEAGRVEASYQPTDLAALTADLASSFRSAVEKAGLRLAVDCLPLAQPVYVDRDMWEKIVLNLISNAIKFTFKGEIGVRLGPSSDGQAAELTVSDTGTGIAAIELPHLFERFYRVEGARSRTHEGTGIGLALVQELAKLHGGKVSVESEPNRGSAFTVRIPFGSAHLPRERVGAGATLASMATKAEAYVEEALCWLPDHPSIGEFVAPDREPLAPRKTDEKRPPTQRGRVLLVEDNADMRDYLKRLLLPHYDVTAAANGQEALDLASAHPPDLVLSDIMMPVLDGLGLLQALRADPATSTLPIILLSARAGEEARVEGLAARADDYLVKPFTARELLARVEVHLSLSHMRKQEAQRERETIELKRAQEELERNESTIRALLDSATQSVVSVNADREIVLVNGNTEKMFGYSREELVGQPLEMLVPEGSRGRHAEHHRAYFANMESRPMGIGLNLEGRRKDGTHFPVEIALSAIDTPAGKCAVAFVSDITQRRRLEQAAQAHAQEVRALAASLLTAQEEERRRVSRELHDQVCQQLASLAIDIGGLAADQVAEDEQHRLKLKALQARIVKASEETRHIAYELHPSVLDDLGVVASLQSLCKDFSERAKDIELEFTDIALPGSIPREVASCLYRVAQEGLQNIAKHANAKHVSVALTLQQGAVVLTITDDGVGFNPEAVKGRGGLGLIGMAERTRMVNRKLSIAAQPSHGTRMALAVPCILAGHEKGSDLIGRRPHADA